MSTKNRITNREITGSDCSSVGRAVPFNSKGPWFESSNWQHFARNKFFLLMIVFSIQLTVIIRDHSAN